MEPYRYHAFVCTQEKGEGVPCCSAAGSFTVLNALHSELGKKGLAEEVQVSTCGCLGVCDSGPVMIVYPEGDWYTKLTPNDVPEIVSSHFQRGQKVARLLAHRLRGDEGRDGRSSPQISRDAERQRRSRHVARRRERDDSRLHGEPCDPDGAGVGRVHRHRQGRNGASRLPAKSKARFARPRCC